MKRDYKLYLSDIKECFLAIEEYLKGISVEEFMKSKLLQDGVMRRLEIIGEASRNMPRAFKEVNKEIPWFDLSQFRDLMAHSYFEVSLSRVWKIAKEDIPQLKEKLRRIKLV